MCARDWGRAVEFMIACQPTVGSPLASRSAPRRAVTLPTVTEIATAASLGVGGDTIFLVGPAPRRSSANARRARFTDPADGLREKTSAAGSLPVGLCQRR